MKSQFTKRDIETSRIDNMITQENQMCEDPIRCKSIKTMLYNTVLQYVF